jgi:signal peptidase II
LFNNMTFTLPSDKRQFSAESLRWVALAVGVGALVMVLDALTKTLVTRELGPNGTRSAIPIAGDFIEFRYGLNDGIAFGMLSGSGSSIRLLVLLVFIPLIFVLIILASRGWLWATAAGLVLGGAAGNLVDRFGDHAVTDFVSVGSWPSFNLADAAVTVGALLLIGLSLLERDPDDPATEKQ